MKNTDINKAPSLDNIPIRLSEICGDSIQRPS